LIHSPIADREYGAVSTSKNPDNTPFEMSFEADHP
jgi:glyoxylase I family protein